MCIISYYPKSIQYPSKWKAMIHQNCQLRLKVRLMKSKERQKSKWWLIWLKNGNIILMSKRKINIIVMNSLFKNTPKSQVFAFNLTIPSAILWYKYQRKLTFYSSTTKKIINLKWLFNSSTKSSNKNILFQSDNTISSSQHGFRALSKTLYTF